MAWDALSRDIPAMPLDDFAANRQTYSGTFIFAAAVQTLEDGKDPVEVFLIKTDALVFYNKPGHAVRG